MAFVTKRSQKKTPDISCEHVGRLEALHIETEVLTRATEVWEARLLVGQQFPLIASNKNCKRKPLLAQVLRLY